MAYSKTSWFNRPSVASPINATNLNKIEAGVDKAISGVENGWNLLTGTFTYASADTPTFVMNTPSDLTGVIGLGMRIKLTQTTAKYFIVTAISSTTITMYGGTDYTLVSATISDVNYSMVKAPFGFPTSPEKWSVIYLPSATVPQTNPVNGTWYNLGGTFNLPIGNWNIISAMRGNSARATAGSVRIGVTLSTTNNGETFAKSTVSDVVGGVTEINPFIVKSFPYSATNKTALFVNAQTTTTSITQIAIYGGNDAYFILCTCAYL